MMKIDGTPAKPNITPPFRTIVIYNIEEKYEEYQDN